MNNHFLRAAFGLCVTVMAPSFSSAYAATDGDALKEIGVTAQRRSDNMQTAPMAVTAITPTQHAAAGELTTLESAPAPPGVQVLNIGGAVTAHIRDIGPGFTTAGFESPVAMYVDGVYLAFAARGPLPRTARWVCRMSVI
jgi:iron complex outermembrane receptor protein